MTLEAMSTGFLSVWLKTEPSRVDHPSTFEPFHFIIVSQLGKFISSVAHQEKHEQHP